MGSPVNRSAIDGFQNYADYVEGFCISHSDLCDCLVDFLFAETNKTVLHAAQRYWTQMGHHRAEQKERQERLMV